MASMSSDLRSRLQQNPSAVVRLIIRLNDDPQAHVPALTARGLTVRHTYALTSSLAIEGSASASLALANEAWVVSIEEDKTVHTM